MHKYLYKGPVKEFDKIISYFWEGETVAQNERRAKSNLSYQFKTKHGRNGNSKITLPGKLEIIE